MARFVSWLPPEIRLAVRALLRRDGPGLAALYSAYKDRALGPSRLRDARPADGSTLRVLVVCHGNIYRSAFASGLIRRELDSRGSLGVRVDSAGTLDVAPRPSPADAVAMAAVFGVSLVDHTSRAIDAESIGASDVIIAMDFANAADILKRFPSVRNKLVLAGSFLPYGVHAGISIPDPNDRGTDALTDSFSLVALAVESIVRILEERSASLDGTQAPQVKRGRLVRVLTSSVAKRAWLHLSREKATVLMLHRFRDSALGINGHSPAMLVRHLAYLRKNQFNLCSLRDLVARLSSGLPPLPRTVVFTVDDGYADFVRVAAPIFSHFRCPVTVFVVTGFLDGKCWMWPDRVRELAGTAARGATTVAIGSEQYRLEWSTERGRHTEVEKLIGAFSKVPDATRLACLNEWEERSGVRLPVSPPPRYSAMSWPDVRRLAATGVDFGPHTHRHPLLSRLDPELARSEITQSWDRLTAELPSAVPVFCYPNGLPGDFTEANCRTVEELGMQAAVAAYGGPCTLADFQRDRFALPRFAYEESFTRFHQLIGGFEAVKAFTRRFWATRTAS